MSCNLHDVEMVLIVFGKSWFSPQTKGYPVTVNNDFS